MLKSIVTNASEDANNANAVQQIETDSKWKVLRNRVVLSITDSKTGKVNNVFFKFTTAEQSRVLGQYIRRSLSERKYTYELQFLTPEGFQGTPGVKPMEINKSESQFSALTKIRHNEAVAKLEVRLFRANNLGGNCRFTMYFASMADLNIAYNLVVRGLYGVYKVVTTYRRDKSLHLWREIQPYRFCDERVSKACDLLTEEQIESVLEFINSIKANPVEQMPESERVEESNA